MSWLDNLFKTKKKRIFLDYASATPVLREVREVMDRYWSRAFYNPSSIYEEGTVVKKEILEHRTKIARLLGITPQGVIFTSGGTESDNLAVLGVFEESRKVFKRPHIIISSIEHPAVTEAAAEVVRRGGELSVVKVNEDGLVNPDSVRKLLKRTTVLVSIGLANSEIGTIQNISKIARGVRKYRKINESIYPYLHTDASAGASYLPIELEKLHADLLTLDGSKIYGPKGIGILALRTGVKISPIIFGGSQEEKRRAGTPNTALIAGISHALTIAMRDREKEALRLENLRKQFIENITKKLPQAILNGAIDSRLPNIVSVSVPNVLSEFVVLKLDREGVLASVGTACSNDEMMNGSPVIRAIGRDDLAESTIRFSFGRFTNSSDVNEAAKIFCRIITRMLK